MAPATIATAAPVTLLEYVDSAFNCWHTAKTDSEIGWVAGEYSEITTG